MIDHFEPDDAEQNHYLAALSYLWILCLVPLLLKKNSKFCQFHARQGTVIFALEIIGTFFIMVPFFGQIYALILIIASVYGFLNAIQGKAYRLPGIFHFSEKIFRNV